MSQERNKMTVRRIYEEVFNQMDLDLIDDLYRADIITHDPHLPPEAGGTDYLKALCQVYNEAFPDLRYEVDELLADGDRVIARWRATGTHGGPLKMGDEYYLPPSGNRVEVQGISVSRLEDGKVAEVWQIVDMLGAFRQMDAVNFVNLESG